MESCNPSLWEKWLCLLQGEFILKIGLNIKTVNDSGKGEGKSDVNVFSGIAIKVCIPLCCKLAVGGGLEGGREASGQREVVEMLYLQTPMIPEMAVQQEDAEEEKEEEGRALCGRKRQTYFKSLCSDLYKRKCTAFYKHRVV